ncbi:MAG: hypothetical protein C0501_15205 [Isosphaera sp.]|nr:hypothetical protein [Isosphaera sp.]
MNAGRSLGAALALALAAAWAGGQPPKQPKREVGNLKVGDAVPDFELADATGKNAVKLSGLKGKPAVLVFGSCT